MPSKYYASRNDTNRMQNVERVEPKNCTASEKVLLKRVKKPSINGNVQIFCTQMFVRQIIITPQLCPPPLGFGAAAPGGKLA